MGQHQSGHELTRSQPVRTSYEEEIGKDEDVAHTSENDGESSDDRHTVSDVGLMSNGGELEKGFERGEGGVLRMERKRSSISSAESKLTVTVAI